MKHIYIYEKDNDLYLSEFPTLNSAHISYTISDKKIYEYLSSISLEIKEIYEKGSSIQIDFGEFVITANVNLLMNRNMQPLMKKINKYNSVVEDDIQGKKVVRKNKHVGRKIIATGLALITIYSVAKTIKKPKLSNENMVVSASDEETNINIKAAVAQQTKAEDPAEATPIDFKSLETNEETTISDSVSNISNDEKASTDIFEILKSNECNVYIDYSGFKADEEKSNNVDNNYSDIIIKYSKKYGIDPEIMIAIAKQERGFHSSRSDGYATGLMQIENNVWIGETIRVFNYDIDDFESIKVTEDLISSLDGNIKVGCMIFSIALSQMKNNVIAAIQCYNMGYGNMVYKILREYSYDCGKSVFEVLEDPTDIGWLDYRNVVKNQGDKYYLERILSYMQDKLGDRIQIQSLGKTLNIKCPSKVK